MRSQGSHINLCTSVSSKVNLIYHIDPKAHGSTAMPEIKYSVIILSSAVKQGFCPENLNHLLEHWLQPEAQGISLSRNTSGKMGHQEGIFTQISFNHCNTGVGFGT